MAHDAADRPSTIVAGRLSPTKVSGIYAQRAVDGDHELSIGLGTGGRDRGVRPRSKVSMTIMRPPQHGHGCESALRLGVAGAAGFEGCSLGR